MQIQRLRNLGIVAHIDAGKTTVSERILYYAGVEHRMGEVHEGTAVMDWMEEERKRGITITAAATSVPWREHTINLIDTPGHVDFTVEVERCMRVLDGAVLVVNGVAGVQAQSETVWRQMQRHSVACLAFVNHFDRAGADFFKCVQDLRERLGAPALPIQFPVGSERGFRSVVDLVAMRCIVFPEEGLGRDPVEVDLPAAYADELGVLRAELVETLAEEDEEVLGAFSEDREPHVDVLRRALRRRVLARSVVPVLVGAALRNVGVQPLLDAVVDYLPAPDEVPPVRGRDPKTGAELVRAPDPDGPLCALAFKLAADPHDDLVFARIYSGTLRPGTKVFNPRVKRMERIARVLHMHADTRRAVDEAGPGDIVALTGCKLTATGDTLCGHDDAIVLERLVFPEPVVSKVVEPRATDDRDRLRTALDRLAFEDPSFVVREDEDTGQWLIAGMGELHLEIKEHRLRDEFRVDVNVGDPRVEYREALISEVSGSGKVDRLLGGSRVTGEIQLTLRPAGPLGGGEHGPPRILWGPECRLSEDLRPAVAESLALAAQVGPRFGFPLLGVEVEVTGGGSDGQKESELGATQAGAIALREALAGAEVALLEPLMAVEVEAPAEFMSGILAELNSKRAEISQLHVDGELRRVEGHAPLFHLFGYATTFRSLSQGRATFGLTPAGFRRVAEDELEARGLVWA